MSEYESTTSYDASDRPAPVPRTGLLYLAAATALLLALGCAILGLMLVSARRTADSASAESEKAQKQVEKNDDTIRLLKSEKANLSREADEQAKAAEGNLQKAQDDLALARRKLEEALKKDAGPKPATGPATPTEAEKLLEEARKQLGEAEKNFQKEREKAVAAEKKAAEAKAQADAARQAALVSRRDAMKQVVGLHLAQATQLNDAGDLPRALLWYTAALRLADKEGLPEQVQRSGLALALGRYPKPIQTWFSDTPISAARLSPDGRQIVTAAAEGVRFWDIATGKQVGGTLNAGAPVTNIAFSPDGKQVLGIAASGRVQLWDIATGKAAIPPLEHPAAAGKPMIPPVQPSPRVRTALFSPDGKRLLTDAPNGTDQSTLRVWDLAKGEIVGKPHEQSGILAVAFSADGSEVLFAGADKVVHRWNPLTDKVAGVALSYPATVSHMTFSSDGQRVATAGSDDAVRVWQVATGQAVTPLLTGAGSALAPQFSVDGQRLLTVGADRTAHIWDAATGSPLAQVRHTDKPILATFSGDGRYVLTASADGLLLLSDAANGHEVQRIWQGTPVQSAALTSDGAAVVTLDAKAVRVWDLTVTEPTAQTIAESPQTWFSPDGKLVLRVKGTTAQLSTVDQDKPVGAPMKHKFPITTAMFSGDSKSIATMSNAPAGSDGEIVVQVWDAATGKESGTAISFFHPVALMAINHDGKIVLAVTVNNAVDYRLGFYETATGKLIGKDVGSQQPIARALFTPNGKLAVTALPAGQERCGTRPRRRTINSRGKAPRTRRRSRRSSSAPTANGC
jgi:WD40 repeat protein